MTHSTVPATKGRRYCFVAMTFRDRFSFYESIRQLIVDAGFVCVRADDLPGSDDLRRKIHDLIEGAALLIAEISDGNPSVHYEVGYAAACKKPLMLLVQESGQVAADLSGLEIIRYTDNRDGHLVLQKTLRERLVMHANPLPLMLPANPTPTAILLNPNWPDVVPPTERGQPATYGDYRAVHWISTAFASIFGEGLVPQLVSASLPPADPYMWDANLYLIGSPRVNGYTQGFLDALQRDRIPRWNWRRAGDRFEIVGTLDNGVSFVSPVMSSGYVESEPYVDFGLLMRGAHPRHPNRIVTLIAGPRCLGTLAACIASTRSDLVREIANRCDLSDRSQTICVLVRGACHRKWHIDPEEVDVVDVGTCQPLSS
jgi:hypothetical protein